MVFAVKKSILRSSDSGKAKPIIPLILLLLAVSYFCYKYYLQLKERSGPMKATGTVEVTEIDLSFQKPGLIQKIFVSSGDSIKKDDLIAILDDSEAKLELQSRQAILEQARAHLEDLQAGTRWQEIKEARAILSQAESSLQKTKSDYERTVQLYQDGVVSTAQRDELVNALDIAENQYKAAKMKVDLLEEGTRPKQIDAALWQLEQASVAVQLAQEYLDDGQLKAPLDSIILYKETQAGEYASPGKPIVTIGDLKNLEVKVYIPEDQLGKVTHGQKVQVMVDTFPEQAFIGQVTEISNQAEFTPKFIQTKKERVHLVFQVKIQLSNEQELLKPGMPADVIFSELTKS